MTTDVPRSLAVRRPDKAWSPTSVNTSAPGVLGDAYPVHEYTYTYTIMSSLSLLPLETVSSAPDIWMFGCVHRMRLVLLVHRWYPVHKYHSSTTHQTHCLQSPAFWMDIVPFVDLRCQASFKCQMCCILTEKRNKTTNKPKADETIEKSSKRKG